MKGKKYRKRFQETQGEARLSKLETQPLTIKFNISKDNIACFIGDRRSAKKRSQKRSPSKKKNIATEPCLQSPTAKKIQKEGGQFVRKQSDSEELVQGSLNKIVSEIENKGIDCAWSESEQLPLTEQNQQNYSSELWSLFSVKESHEKSIGSTMDVRSNFVYCPEESLGYRGYESFSGYKGYDEGSVFVVRPSQIAYDPRTTIMVRNIPNKYTIKELSEEIDCYLVNTYDFLYLPCDIKNQCNVGYGFINFLDTQYLQEFYRIFEGRKWSKFRSQKICNLTYARLQGLNSLIDHFENSKVLNQKDKKYRPIIRQIGKIQSLIRTQQSD